MTGMDKDDDALLAAEYALGLLEGDEARAAARRAAGDADFARLVTDWEIGFAHMAEDLPEVAPSAAVKTALMRDLFPQAARTGVWQNLRLWRGIGVLSAVLLGLVLGAMLMRPPGNVSLPYRIEPNSSYSDPV